MKQQLLLTIILLSILSVSLAPVFAQKEDNNSPPPPTKKEDKPIIKKEDKPTPPPKVEDKQKKEVDKTTNHQQQQQQVNDNSGSNNVDQKTTQDNKKDIPITSSGKDKTPPTIVTVQPPIEKKVKCDKDTSKLDKKTNTCVDKKKKENPIKQLQGLFPPNNNNAVTNNNGGNNNPTTPTSVTKINTVYKNYIQNKFSSNTKISSSSSFKQIVNNNIFGASPTISPTFANNTNTVIPTTLLLLDAKQLLDSIAGSGSDDDNSGIAGLQSLFCTTSLVTIYNQQEKTWNIAGNVQNINTITPNAVPNVKANALFYDVNGNSIGGVSNISLAKKSLAQNEESPFTFSANIDNDMNGQMPTFIVIFYTF